MLQPQEKTTGILVIQVLLIVQAIFDLIGGLSYLGNRNDLSTQFQTGMTSTELSAAGFFLLLSAFFFFWVSYDLGRGKRAAQWILTVIATLHVMAAIWVAFDHDGAARNDLLPQGVIALIVLIILHTHAADRFFNQRGHT